MRQITPAGPLELELGNGLRHRIEPVWQHGDLAGFRFVRGPVGLPELLGITGPFPRRGVRLRAEMPVTVSSPEGPPVATLPDTPIADEWLSVAMLYSSGTTGQPKGIVRPLPEVTPDVALPLYTFLSDLWHCRDGMIYLSPAPLYHSAPQAAVALAGGGGAVLLPAAADDGAGGAGHRLAGEEHAAATG